MELHKGDTILLKSLFLESYNIPRNFKSATVVSISDHFIQLDFESGDSWFGSIGFYDRYKYFYKSDNLNDDFINLLIDCQIEIKSISATTVDGKIINMELPS